jgi:glycosyltransferase involved in cell wall biosynthesis
MNSPDPCMVLFVESYPQSLFGQQETLSGLLARCAEIGIAPHIAAPREGIFLDRLRNRGYSVEVISQPEKLSRYGGRIYADGIAAKFQSGAQAMSYIATVRRWMKRAPFGVVFCNDMRGLLTFGIAARTLGLPVVTWDKLDKPHGWLDHLQLPLVTKNIVISKSVIRKYPEWQVRQFNGRIRRIFDGIDIASYQSIARPAAPLPQANGATVIGIAGTVTPRKGHDLLFKAFHQAQQILPSLQLWVIGDALSDEDKEFRDQLARDYDGESINWLGFRRDMPAVIQHIDVLASPSRHEGMGRVNIEAMAAGKPVIGASGTGIAEVVVDGETGFLLDPADTSAFAERILVLARDLDLRTRMGEAGRRRAAEQFDQDKQLLEVLNEIRDAASRRH